MHLTLDGSALLVELVDDGLSTLGFSNDANIGKALLQIRCGLDVMHGEDDAVETIVSLENHADLPLQQLTDSEDALGHMGNGGQTRLIGMTGRKMRLKGLGEFFQLVALNDVVLFVVAEPVELDAAFESVANFGDFILEAAEGFDPTTSGYRLRAISQRASTAPHRIQVCSSALMHRCDVKNEFRRQVLIL